MHIITAKIKVFQKPQAFLTIIMINEAIKKQTEDNYYICNKKLRKECNLLELSVG